MPEGCIHSSSENPPPFRWPRRRSRAEQLCPQVAQRNLSAIEGLQCEVLRNAAGQIRPLTGEVQRLHLDRLLGRSECEQIVLGDRCDIRLLEGERRLHGDRQSVLLRFGGFDVLSAPGTAACPPKVAVTGAYRMRPA